MSGEDRSKFSAVLDRYVALLLKWNERINLTAARDRRTVEDEHIRDAELVARAVRPGDRLVDVGSGAGLPGLVVAILRPGAEVTLVEPNAKKVAFLRAAVEHTECRNVTVIRGRDSDLPGESWDRAVSRATMEPPAWLAAGARLVPIGGRVGVLVADETKLPEDRPGLSQEDVDRATLPSGAPRVVAWYLRSVA
jgi:16S rRNA (guanine527-N7)-methyltransferase